MERDSGIGRKYIVGGGEAISDGSEDVIPALFQGGQFGFVFGFGDWEQVGFFPIGCVVIKVVSSGGWCIGSSMETV